MRVLVTGAAGFLGRHVLAALSQAGHEAVAAGHDTALPVEFRLSEQVEDLFAEVRPEAVVHLAGTSRREDFVRGPPESRTENVSHPLLNVLDLAGARQVVHLSSAAACGDGPFEEDAPLRPRDLYGAARASAEVFGSRRATGPFVVLRPFLLHGEGAPVCTPFDSRSALHRPDTEVDILDVRDAAAAVLAALSPHTPPGTLTVSSGRTLPLHVLLAQGRIRAAEMAPCEGPLRRWSAPALRLRALGWSPAYPVPGAT